MYATMFAMGGILCLTIVALIISSLFYRRCRYQLQLTLPGPPDQLFRCITEPHRLLQWIGGLVSCDYDSGDSTKPGAVSTLTLRAGEHLNKMRSEVIEVTPDTWLKVKLTALDGPKWEGISEYRLQSQGQDTLLSVHHVFDLQSWFLRAMAPVFMLVGKKKMVQDFERLRRLLEVES